jgi:hypothetical protein
MVVIGARVAAPVAQRRALAGGADLERPARTGELVAAISAEAEHVDGYRLVPPVG